MFTKDGKKDKKNVTCDYPEGHVISSYPIRKLIKGRVITQKGNLSARISSLTKKIESFWRRRRRRYRGTLSIGAKPGRNSDEQEEETYLDIDIYKGIILFRLNIYKQMVLTITELIKIPHQKKKKNRITYLYIHIFIWFK